jgi:hypothetical protein
MPKLRGRQKGCVLDNGQVQIPGFGTILWVSQDRRVVDFALARTHGTRSDIWGRAPRHGS